MALAGLIVRRLGATPNNRTLVATEASAQAVRAFRGASGPATIRGGMRTIELSPGRGAHLLPRRGRHDHAADRLAQAVSGAGGLKEANDALNALGVSTGSTTSAARPAR